MDLPTRLDVSPSMLAAVMAVESAGSGFEDGKPKIRLEVHQFWDHVKKLAPDRIADVDACFHVLGPERWQGHRYRIAPDSPWWNVHAGQATEYEAFGIAMGIHEDSAVRATSWGAYQVLGNWPELGLSGPDAVRSLALTEDGQAELLCCYLEHLAPACLIALRAHDWLGFARGYNGPGKAADYASLLETAYNRIRRHS